MSDKPDNSTDKNAPDTASSQASDSARLDAVEAKQDSMSATLNQVLSILKGDGGKTDQPATEPGTSNVAEEIRQQLEERDRKQRADEEKKHGDDRLGALETRVSELAEKPPGPLPRRVEKLMGWL